MAWTRKVRSGVGPVGPPVSERETLVSADLLSRRAFRTRNPRAFGGFVHPKARRPEAS